MKFYNLTYDCNNPVVQQINVPTNTDYKVGVKVLRNGEEQVLSPSEVTLDTLSADTDKTNGYITFTESTGDEPSYVEKTIAIEHNYDIVEYTNVIHNTSGSTQSGLSVVLQNAGDIGLAGKTVTPETFLMYRKTNLSAEPTLQEINEQYQNCWDNEMVVGFTLLVDGDKGKIYYYTGMAKQMLLDAFKEEGRWTESDGPIFVYLRPGSQNYEPLKEYEFDGSETIFLGANKLQAGKYCAGAVKFLTGPTPFNAKFKLVENAFKSQQGDICELGKRASTVNISGTLADNTPFDFNAVIK